MATPLYHANPTRLAPLEVEMKAGKMQEKECVEHAGKMVRSHLQSNRITNNGSH